MNVVAAKGYGCMMIDGNQALAIRSEPRGNRPIYLQAGQEGGVGQSIDVLMVVLQRLSQVT